MVSVKKLTIAAIAFLVTSGATVGTYFGITKQDPFKGIKLGTTSPKKKESFGASSISYERDPFKQGFQASGDYYKFGDGRVATEHENDFYTRLISELENIGSNATDSDVLMLPKYYYDNYVLDNPLLKSLTYNNKHFASRDYQLANSLNLKIFEDAGNRPVLARFIDYIKETRTVRNLLNSKMINMDPFNNNLIVNDDECFRYNIMKSSNRLLQSLMGTLYSTFNCKKGYGFGGFSFSDFLSTFLEIKPREVVVGEKPADYEGNQEYMSLEQAQGLSNIEGIQKGDKVTVYSDIREILANLDLKKLDLFKGVMSTINSKLKGDEETSDITAILTNLIESNSKFDVSTSNTMIAVMLSIGGAIAKSHQKAQSEHDYQSVIKNGDFITSLFTETGRALEDIVKDIIYGNKELVTFFFDKLLNNKDPQQKVADYLIKKYELKIQDLQTNSETTNSNLKKLEDELKELEKKIPNYINEELANRRKRGYQLYTSAEKNIDMLTFEQNSLNNSIGIKQIILTSYKRELDSLEKASSSSEKMPELKDKIDQIEVELAELNLKLKETTRNLNEAKRILAEQGNNQEYQEWLLVSNKLKAAVKRRTSLNNDILKLKAEKRTKAGMSKTNQFKIKKLENWSKTTNKQNALEMLREGDLTNVLELFIDVVSTVTYDAAETLGLGAYNSNDEFEFADFSCGMSCIDYSLFFKEKGAINVINKLIDFFNTTVSKFSKNSLRAAGKFLINSLPDALFTILDIDISYLGIDINFKKGIDIYQEQVYGLLAGGGAAAGGILGSAAGSAVGAITGKARGKKVGKYAFLGAAIGFIAGLVTGATAGGVTAWQLFGDGELHINKPNEEVINIILDLKKKVDRGEDISFNLFTDGHVLVKEKYIENLNRLFSDLGRLFLYSNKQTYDVVERFNHEYSYERFSGWNLIGEMLKVFLISPYFWKEILTRSNYELDQHNEYVLKSSVLNDLRKAMTYSREQLKDIFGIRSPLYRDQLFNFQNTILNWIFPTIFINENTKLIKVNSENNIRIGYSPDQIRIENLRRLGEDFRSLANLNVDIVWVDYTKEGFSNLDAYFNYQKMNDQMLESAKLNLFELQELAQGETTVNIPLFKSIIIPITTIFNTIRNIDEEFIRDHY